MTLLVLAIKRSRCGWPPALRISEHERGKKMADPDDEVVLSYKCQNRNCDETYPITAKSYKGAA